MSAQPLHIPYTISFQEEHDKLMPGGQFQRVWTVTFLGPSGTTASVDVPETDYNPANVDALIQAKLQNIESVHQLGLAPASGASAPTPSG